MKSSSPTDRIIFGLKAKQLRLERKLSFADLASATGMSLSYLNEIEKGKKFPKQDKIVALANALGTTVEQLSSGHLDRHLAPVESLLRSNFLNDLPLDLFGIELNKVVEIVASAPVRVAAFISTLLQLSRSYNLREENFYFGALRAYLELNENFFPEIEAAVDTFCQQHDIPYDRPLDPSRLRSILEKEYQYTIVKDGLAKHEELTGLRALYLEQGKRLLLQSGLKSNQAAFQYGKEIAFNYLKLGERAATSSLMHTRSFEEVINHSKAIYFSAALHLPLASFTKDIAAFFRASHWDPTAFLGLLSRYNVNPETFYHRLTNVIPQHFGFSRLFFLRFVHSEDSDTFTIDRELHLDRRTHPRSNASREHYCRRWLSVRMLDEMKKGRSSQGENELVTGVQRSRYYGTNDEYLCITLARSGYPTSDKNVSVTLGLLINDEFRAFCNWVEDPAIDRIEVNTTCERCPIEDCQVRAAPPSVVQRKQRQLAIERTIQSLAEEE